MTRSIFAILTSPDRIPPKALVAWYVDGFVASWESSHSCDCNVLSPTLEMTHSQSISKEHLCILNILQKWMGERTWMIWSYDCRRATLGFARFAMNDSFLIQSSIAAMRFALRTSDSPSMVCSRRRRIHKSSSSNSSRRDDGDNVLPLHCWLVWSERQIQICAPEILRGGPAESRFLVVGSTYDKY